MRFFNPGGIGPKGPGAFLKWTFGERGEAWPASFPSPHAPDRPPVRFDREAFRVTHVGHASYLIQTRGRNMLVDPVWGERVSPFSFLGPKRVNAPGIAFDDLPKIDAVLITHNHYDHMDVETIGRLWQRFRPRIVTPLGNDAILRRPRRGSPPSVVDWDDTVDLGDGLIVHAEPTVHWSARGAGDRMHALWASFVVQSGDRKVYCVGDSGFGDGATFSRVRGRHPKLALAILPIGAYEPRWFMRNNHMNPAEAVRGAGAVRRGPGPRPPLGHLPPHQRGRRRAAEGSRGRARRARHRARAISRAAARRRACRGLTGTRADERGGERATPSAEWRIAVIMSAFSSAHSLVP